MSTSTRGRDRRDHDRRPDRPGPTPAAAALALRAVLDDAAPLSQAERALLGEWLGRLATPH